MAHDQIIMDCSWGYWQDRLVRERVVEVTETAWRLFPEVELMPRRSDYAQYAGRNLEELLAMYEGLDRIALGADAVDGVLSKESWSIVAADFSFDIAPASLKPYSRLNTNTTRRRRYNDRLFEVFRAFGAIPHCRELWCRHTAFMGDPYFLYRPPLMKMLDDFTVFKQAIQPVNAMLDVLDAHVDRDEILDVLKRHGLEVESMSDGKVFVKFCDMFEDWVKNPLIKSPKEILKEVRTRVESRLREQGLTLDWLDVKVPRPPRIE